jgi:hypothetical protein
MSSEVAAEVRGEAPGCDLSFADRPDCGGEGDRRCGIDGPVMTSKSL